MMLRVVMSEAEVQEECAAALADAELTPDRVRFYPLTALGAGHVGATWFRPYVPIEPGERFPDEAQRLEANRWDNRQLHAIALPAQPAHRPTFAGLVRHELEHACQWEADPRITTYYDFIHDEVLPVVAGDLDGCAGLLINSIPAEVDCNAAASVYLASRFSPTEVQEVRDGPRANLACSLIPPPPPETLPARMIAFAFVYRAAVERLAAQGGFQAAALLGKLHPGAPDLWEQLEEGLQPGR